MHRLTKITIGVPNVDETATYYTELGLTPTTTGFTTTYAWGPPPPPSFLAPDDLAELMTDAHNGA